MRGYALRYGAGRKSYSVKVGGRKFRVYELLNPPRQRTTRYIMKVIGG